VPEPDPQVVRAARGGDAGAFESLVRFYQAQVWRLCFHLLHDETLADDVTQEALVKAYRFLPNYRGESKFSTWLYSITRNCALDELRRAGRRHELLTQLGHEPGPQARDHSVRIEVREAIAALPLELREAVVLIDMFGTSYSEASTILGVPLGTVKSRVHRARLALARWLLPASRGSAGEA
jgi:RNA polymerase sigma-70 factor (ECF subfamily)